MKVWEYFAWGQDGWLDELLSGLVITSELAITSYTFGLAMGVVWAMVALSRYRLLRLVAEAYMGIGRSIPELLIIFLMYYGANQAVNWFLILVGANFSVEVSPFACGVLALGFIVGAGAASIIRGAMLSLDQGQPEAGYSLGLGRIQVLVLIILPQVTRIALPGLSNLWMGMLKETALVSAIGLSDVLRAARVAAGSTNDAMPFMLAAGFCYLFLTAISLIVIGYLRRHYALATLT